MRSCSYNYCQGIIIMSSNQAQYLKKDRRTFKYMHHTIKPFIPLLYSRLLMQRLYELQLFIIKSVIILSYLLFKNDRTLNDKNNIIKYIGSKSA